MKNLKKFVFIILCAVLCVPIFYGCGKQNNKAIAEASQHEYNLHVVLNDENKTLDIVENLIFNNFSTKTLAEIKLNLYANAYREGAKFQVVPEYLTDTFPNGKSYGSINISNVSENNNVAKYEVCGDDQNILKIILNEPVKPSETINLSFEYSISLANIRHRLGYADEVFTLSNFYISPCFLNYDGTFFENHYYNYGDPFAENLAKFNIKFICSNGYNVFSSGMVLNENQNLDSTKTLTLSSNLTRSFAIVASKNLKTISRTENGIKILYAYLNDDDPQNSIGTASNALNIFSKSFGDLNAKQICVVAAPYTFGGMEFSNLVLITSTALKDREEYNNIIVHELAHQWWYSAVGNNQITEPFLDESLTEFSTLYYTFKTQGLMSLRELAAKNLNSHILFLEVEKNMYGEIDESLNRGLDGYKTAGEYSQMVYTRGSLMFYNLFELLGEKKFDKALQNYFSKNCYKTASLNNLISAFNNSCKINLTSFFNNWLSGNIEISQI